MSSRGEQFRAEIGAQYDLTEADASWTALLDETCRALDLLERIEANIADQPLMVDGSKGQDRVNPLVQEARLLRQQIGQFLNGLGLGEQETQSQRQSRYARRRWS